MNWKQVIPVEPQNFKYALICPHCRKDAFYTNQPMPWGGHNPGEPAASADFYTIFGQAPQPGSMPLCPHCGNICRFHSQLVLWALPIRENGFQGPESNKKVN